MTNNNTDVRENKFYNNLVFEQSVLTYTMYFD